MEGQQQQQQQQQQLRLKFGVVVCCLLLLGVVSASPAGVSDGQMRMQEKSPALPRQGSPGFSLCFYKKKQHRENRVIKTTRENWVLRRPTQDSRTRTCDRESGLLGGQGDHGPHALPSSDRPFLGDAVSRLA